MTGLSSPGEEEPLDADPPAAPVLTSAVLSGKANQDVVLSWSLSTDDGSGDDDVSHYAIYFSQAYDYDGDRYSYLGQVGGGETQFTHTLAGDGDWNDYFYCVQANDTSGNANWSGQAGKFVRNMEEGKQLASIPLIQDDTTLEVVLQTLKGSFKHVRYYKSSDQSDHWKSYWTFKTYGDLYEIDHKMGFWIDIKKADHLVVAGLVPEDTQIELGHGWNLVGYSSFIERTVSQALADVEWEKVQGYGDDPPFHQVQLKGSDLMRAGEGYWIWVDLPQVWEVLNRPAEPPYILWTMPVDGELDVPLNVTVYVKFSEEMDTSTVTWTVIPDPAGYYEYWLEGNTLLEIHRTSLWPENAMITIAVDGKDTEGNSLVSGPVPNPWSFGTGTTVGPYIVGTDPYNAETAVELDRNVVVWFSEPMDPSTATVTATPTIAFDFTWTNNNMTLYLSHAVDFDQCTQYVLEIDARDLDNNPLIPGPVPNPFWFVTIGIGLDPYILETDPYDKEANVDLYRSITVYFSEPMNTSSFTWTIAPDPGGWYGPDWRFDDTVVILGHTTPFPPCTTYYIRVTYAEDKDGNPLVAGPVPNPWTFEVASCPYILLSEPAANETNVSTTQDIYIQFSDPMNASSLLWKIDPDPGRWSEIWPSDTVVVIVHTDPFQPWTTYFFELTYIENIWGVPLCSYPVSWSFTTGG